MIKHLKHLPHAISLIGILFAGFAGLILFSYDRNFQITVALATAIAYISWGVAHHYLHKDLYFEVFVEYLSVAFLGFTILYFLILR